MKLNIKLLDNIIIIEKNKDIICTDEQREELRKNDCAPEYFLLLLLE